MATVTATQLNGAITLNDTSIRVDAVTGFAKGQYARLDNEYVLITSDPDATALTMDVKRGQMGTAAVAHVDNSPVVTTTDPNTDIAFMSQIDEAIPTPNQVSLPRYSYAAAGALTPSKGLHMILGTSALAMTLAVPSKLNDGDIMYIVANGKAAHTVTFATAMGDGGSNLDLATFAAGGQQCLALIAANGIWVPLPSFLAGTLTNVTITMS